MPAGGPHALKAIKQFKMALAMIRSYKKTSHSYFFMLQFMGIYNKTGSD